MVQGMDALAAHRTLPELWAAAAIAAMMNFRVVETKTDCRTDQTFNIAYSVMCCLKK